MKEIIYFSVGYLWTGKWGTVETTLYWEKFFIWKPWKEHQIKYFPSTSRRRKKLAGWMNDLTWRHVIVPKFLLFEERGGFSRPFSKGHSQLWDRVVLGTSFLTLKKVHPNLESKFILKSAIIFAVFCLIFNLLMKNLFLSVLLFSLWYYFYHIWLKRVWIPSLLYAD